jgi:hypothetical protein
LSPTPPPFSCGIALPARTLSGCLLDQGGAVLGHRQMNTTPAALLHAMPPARQGMGDAGVCLCPGDWRAARWAAAGSPCVLGPARSRPALPGGQATNAQIDSHTRAALLRGGLRPPAAGSPAPRRATRALRRRRMPLAHTRAARLAPGPPPPSPETRPAMGPQLADKANRAGGAARVAAPAVPQRLAVALARSPDSDALLRDVARTIGTPAPHHDVPPGRCGNPGPGAARCSAACGAPPSLSARAAPGARRASPRAAWAHVWWSRKNGHTVKRP